ncbi:Uncharacterised protein [Mycobacterium tuberculosis]|nr:Uncharacterised protein [Mycobacterium tuberculosis]
MRWSLLPTPTVPNSIPVSHTASAHGRTISCTRSGRASVVKSRSGLNRPNSASRTEPPTRYNSCPAAANTDPSSRNKAACLFKATAAAVSRSASWTASGTFDQPNGSRSGPGRSVEEPATLVAAPVALAGVGTRYRRAHLRATNSRRQD